MSQKKRTFSSTNAWVYLANNGPSTNKELPNHPRYSDRQDGVRKFNLKASYSGSSASGGSQKVPVYYIDGKHDPRRVVEIWIKNNRLAVENVPGKALYWRCPEEFRPHLKDLLNIEFQKHGGDSGIGGTCSMCGEEYDRHLPDHLPECSEK